MVAGLHGAFLLARGQARGLNYVEDTPEGAARSFWAAAICLPAFFGLRLLSWALGEAPEASAGRALSAELLGYACAWAGFALASRPLAVALGKEARWPHFLAAWNWSNVVQYAVLLVLTLPALLGLAVPLAGLLSLIALGYAIWLEWFVARTALGINGGQAAGFVLLDLVIGLFIGGFVATMAGG